MISSGFGYRSDPFHGGAAMHAGLDFRGHIGAPIHAAAQGQRYLCGNQDPVTGRSSKSATVTA